jgi:hypothetical protein
MKKAARIASSVFFLIVFLFPFIGENCHAFAHSGDVHCTEQTERHIHELEHHCTLCDFNFSIPDINGFHFSFSDACFSTFDFSFLKERKEQLFSAAIFFLRGPPCR